MEIYFEKTNETKKIDLKENRVLKEIVDEFGISLDSVILTKNGEVCLEETQVSNEDKIAILSVVSGG